MSAAKERPIIFRGDMVRAILAGTKTVTRRVVKLSRQANPHHGSDLSSPLDQYDRARVGLHIVDDGAREYGALFESCEADVFVFCPYGAPGDRLWVRETLWRNGGYVATDPPPHANAGKVSAIHMPRWASRLTLVVKDVRVERLREITDEDAKAEGVTPTIPIYGDPGGYPLHQGHREAFLKGFRSMHGLDENADPWVWRIAFSREFPQ